MEFSDSVLGNHIESLFCNQSRLSLDFSVLPYFRWGYVDQYIIVFISLCFPCVALSVPRGIARGLLTNRKSIPWLEPSVFSITSMGTLLVNSGLEGLIFGRSFWIRVFFLWPSFQSASCRHLFCCGWKWIF